MPVFQVVHRLTCETETQTCFMKGGRVLSRGNDWNFLWSRSGASVMATHAANDEERAGCEGN